MADILIRGISMPKYTTKAEFGIDADGNPLCMVYHEDGTEPDIYDVVPLPKGHGRLIDADALDRAFTDLRFNSDGTLNHWGDRPGWCMHGYEVEKLIADAPTIIEAEGGGEDG